MAEIISRNNKKVMPRVDLTPMVDLGFLLITFFILTTSMTTQQAMPLIMPADGGHSTASEEKTLNLILKNDNQIVYYNGLDSMHTSVCGFGNENSIRSIIITKQQIMQQKFGNKNELLVLIKPTKESNYKNVVDVLDEMKINAVTRYMIVEPSKFEANF